MATVKTPHAVFGFLSRVARRQRAGRHGLGLMVYGALLPQSQRRRPERTMLLRRRSILPALLGVLGLLTFAGEPGTAAKRQRCAPTTAKTLRATTDVRVYRLRGEKYVCSLRTGHVKRLDRSEESTAYLYDVRGPYVAYEIFVTTRQRSYVAVRSVDARSGRVIVNADAFTGAYRIERSVDAASSLKLLSGGSVAWISRTEVEDGSQEVRYASATVPERVLDTGARIEPRSLAVTPGYVYWTAGDQAKVARVP